MASTRRTAVFASLLALGCSPGASSVNKDLGAGDGGGGGGAGSPTACPHVDLGRALPAVYAGSTDGLPNWVTSNRLEWKDAPDDSLAFEAPADGNYLITLESAIAALGASAEDSTVTMGGGVRRPFTAASCPAAGTTGEIDGVYNHNQPDYPLPLKAGQKIVIWVSTPYWSMTKSGAYKITVTKK